MAGAWLEVLAAAALKGGLLLGAGWAVVRLREPDAAARHAFLAALLLSHLALPALSPVLPAWEVPVAPAWVPVAAPWVPAAPDAIRDPEPAVREGPAPGREGAGGPAPGPAVGLREGGAGSAELPTALGPGPDHDLLSPAATDGSERWAAPFGGTFLFLLWAAGALAGLFRLGVGHVGAGRCLRGARPLGDPGWERDLTAAAARIGLRRRPRLRVAPGIGSPAVTGVVRPTILVPPEAVGWSPRRRWIVLLHETAHIARRDLLVQLLADGVGVLLWFDPLVRWARHALRREGEAACDQAVVRAGVRPSEYVTELAAIARGMPRRTSTAPALARMARPRELEGRARRLLSARRGGGSAPRGVELGLALGVLAVSLPLAAARPVPARTEAASTGWTDEGARSSSPEPPAEGADALARGSGPGPPSGCVWSGGTHRNRWVEGAGGAPAWEVAWDGRECGVRVRGEGLAGETGWSGGLDPAALLIPASAGPPGLPLAPVAAGAVLEIRLRRGEHETLLRLHRREDGGLERSLRAGGRPVPLTEATARAWLARFAVELDRHTGFDVSRRLPPLLARSGVAGVLAEVDRTRGDHAAGVWLRALVSARALEPPELEAVLRIAATDVTNDAVKAGLLGTVARRASLEPPGVRRAFESARLSLRSRAARERIASPGSR